MAGDRDGNRVIDGVRRRQQSDRSDRAAREHRGFLHCDHHRIINLFCEFAIRDARAQLRRELLLRLVRRSRCNSWPMCGGTTVTVSGTVSGQTINFSSFSFSETRWDAALRSLASGTANVAADGCNHRHPQRHIPDAIGSELQCSKPSNSDGQAVLAADRKRHCHAAMSAVTKR